MVKITRNMSSKFSPGFILIYGYTVSGVSPAAGQKNGRPNRKGNFGNVGLATVPAVIWSARWPTLRNSDKLSYKVSVPRLA